MYARLYHSQNNEEAACLRHLPIFMSGQANIYHLNLICVVKGKQKQQPPHLHSGSYSPI